MISLLEGRRPSIRPSALFVAVRIGPALVFVGGLFLAALEPTALGPFADGAPLAAQDPGAEASSAQEARVAAVLDDFHAAASEADFERYFGHFTADAVFIGTDATERWTLDEFRAYAKPVFDRGQGWTYVPRIRHVQIGPDGRTAWFDEILDNTSFGETRGTGVLVREGEDWKVAQYHLTIPIPNALARQVVELIRGGGEGSVPEPGGILDR